MPPTSRAPTSTATSGRPTAATSSRSAAGLQADFGKFASNLGYETNYAKDNNNFSRAYLFNFLPFYHSGLRVSLPLSDGITVMYMLTNGIQQTEDFNDFKSNHFTAVIKPVGSIVWTTNYYFGQEQPDGGEPEGPDGFFKVFDTYVAYTPTAALSFGLDVNYVTNEVNKVDDALSLQGLGVYGRYQLSTPLALAVRYERLDDEGLFGGIDQVLQEITATARIQVRRRLPGSRRVPPRLVEPSRSSPAPSPTTCSATRTPPSSGWCGGSATRRVPGRRCDVLLLGMIVLGLATFVAMLAFVTLCDRV